MLTEHDVLASLVAGEAIETATVAEVMGEAVPSVRSDRDLAVGIDRLAAADVSQLVVTENGSGEPVGLLTHRDVATTIAHSLRSNRSSYGANGTDAGSGRFEGTNRRANDGDTIQGICESCGTLSDSLASVDGQLLCGNCRDV
jgi:hypothetical protein